MYEANTYELRRPSIVH